MNIYIPNNFSMSHKKCNNGFSNWIFLIKPLCTLKGYLLIVFLESFIKTTSMNVLKKCSMNEYEAWVMPKWMFSYHCIVTKSLTLSYHGKKGLF